MGGELIAFILVALIIVGAVVYIVKSKMSGQKCVGCPYSKDCSGKCSCCSDNKEKK